MTIQKSTKSLLLKNLKMINSLNLNVGFGAHLYIYIYILIAKRIWKKLKKMFSFPVLCLELIVLSLIGKKSSLMGYLHYLLTK